jgi:hypothetical protein
MKLLKAKRSLEHKALLEAAARHRLDRASNVETSASAQWQCDRGHAWDESLSESQNVRCMGCALQRREMQVERLQAMAGERGGRLVSAEGDPGGVLQWQCAFGHEWNATAETASRRWCQQCWQQGVYESSRTGASRASGDYAGSSEPASRKQSQKS